MEEASDVLKYSWSLISQFVCWEFCRNMKSKDMYYLTTQTDLMTFFREMVIEMTTRTDENTITKHEVVAKFLEELQSFTIEKLHVIFTFAGMIKKMCPELSPAVQEIILYIEEQFDKDDDISTRDLTSCIEFQEKIQHFSSEAYKFLPVPDLMKIISSSLSDSPKANHTPSKQDIIHRLQKEMLIYEIPQILNIIEEDKTFKYFIDKKGKTRQENDEIEVFFEDTPSDTSTDIISATPTTVSSTRLQNKRKQSRSLLSRPTNMHIEDMLSISSGLNETFTEQEKNILKNITIDADANTNYGCKSPLDPGDSECQSVLNNIVEKASKSVAACCELFSNVSVSVIDEEEDADMYTEASVAGTQTISTDNLSVNSVNQASSRNSLFNDEEDAKPVVCEICSVAFSKQEYEEHSRLCHNTSITATQEIEIAHLLSGSNRQKSTEEEEEEDVKPTICDLCEMAFPRKEDYHKHFRLHYNTSTADLPDTIVIRCELCDKLCTVRPDKRYNFICHICGQTFCCKYHIETHMVVHINVKRFSCVA